MSEPDREDGSGVGRVLLLIIRRCRDAGDWSEGSLYEAKRVQETGHKTNKQILRLEIFFDLSNGSFCPSNEWSFGAVTSCFSPSYKEVVVSIQSL